MNWARLTAPVLKASSDWWGRWKHLQFRAMSTLRQVLRKLIGGMTNLEGFLEEVTSGQEPSHLQAKGEAKRPAMNSPYWKGEDGIQRRFSVLDFNSATSQHQPGSQVLCSVPGVSVGWR